MPLNIEIEVQGCENLTLEIIDAPFYPSVVIDDNAGLGDTDVTWSADKSSRELADKVDKVHTHDINDVTGLSTRLNDIDALIGDVESALIIINGEP